VHRASDNILGIESSGVLQMSQDHEVEHGREIATVLASVMLRITIHGYPLRVRRLMCAGHKETPRT
jgi:hypothetical protein